MSARRRELPQASIHVVKGHSLVIPLIIDGLPSEVKALGERWQRKREFHLTVLAARVVEGLGGEPEEHWDHVADVASGRRLGPVEALDEVRLVSDPDRPALRTLIVMARCEGLRALYDEFSAALGCPLAPPPAHVTLYSTDPAEGIGIVDAEELEAWAPALPAEEQEAVRRAIGFP